MIGYSSDLGSQNCEGSRTGQEKGPDCVREIMKKFHLKIPKDQIEKIMLVDCGNVQDLEALEKLIQSLHS